MVPEMNMECHNCQPVPSLLQQGARYTSLQPREAQLWPKTSWGSGCSLVFTLAAQLTNARLWARALGPVASGEAATRRDWPF